MNAAHAPIFDFLVHIMLARRSKTLIFLYFQKLRYLTSAFDRPAFQEMMAEVKAGRVNCIVVKDLSRFGRDHLGVGEYLEQLFPFLGVRFIAINDNYDSLHSNVESDELVIPFKNLINANLS